MDGDVVSIQAWFCFQASSSLDVSLLLALCCRHPQYTQRWYLKLVRVWPVNTKYFMPPAVPVSKAVSPRVEISSRPALVLLRSVMLCVKVSWC